MTPPTTASDDLPTWQRKLASRANNRAWRLSEQLSRSPAEDDEMLHAAHAAMHLWAQVGNDDNKAHAALLLAHVHALLGEARNASRYLQGPSAHFLSGRSADWEVAIAHAVAANVAAANSDHVAHRHHHAAAAVAIAALPDAEDRDILSATFRVVPIPPV